MGKDNIPMVQKKANLKSQQALQIAETNNIKRFMGAVLHYSKNGWVSINSQDFSRIVYNKLGSGVTKSQIQDLEHLFFNASEDISDRFDKIGLPNGKVWDTAELDYTDKMSAEDCVFQLAVTPTNGNSHREWLEQVAIGDKDLADDMMWAIAPVFMHKKPFGIIWFLGNGSNGKSELSDSTPMLTGEGWSTHGKLKVGDEVYAIDGSLSKVTNIYPKGAEQMYRLTTQDGRTIDCGIDHYWSVIMNGSHKIVVKQTRELINDLHYGKDNRKKWYLPPTSPINTPKQRLPIDPYKLGCLIGDGYIDELGRVDITNNDKSIIYLFDNAQECDYSSKSYTRGKYIARFSSMKEKLVKLNLNGTHSYTKFIPDQYMVGSISQRKSILSGLLDTDGYINSGINQIEFSTSSPQLAEQVRQLVFSLGGTATMTSRMGKYDGIETRENWRIFIRTPFNPFRLHRKAKCWRPQTRTGRTSIVSIEPVHIESAQCIAIDHPSHTYLAGKDFVPTHNTILKTLYQLFGGLKKAPFTKLSLTSIEDGRDIPTMNGRLGNICIESHDGHIKDAGNYKHLAEHDDLEEHKMRTNDTIKINGNIHTIFNTNNIPTFGDKSKAIRDRTFTIPFKAQFERNPNFDEELWEQDNFLSDFLGELLEITKLIRDNGYKYKLSSLSVHARADYDEEANSAEAYLNEIISQDIVAFTSYAPLYTDYENWCKERGSILLGRKTLASAGKVLGFGRQAYRINGKVIKRYTLDDIAHDDVEEVSGRWGLFQRIDSEIELAINENSVDNTYDKLIGLL